MRSPVNTRLLWEVDPLPPDTLVITIQTEDRQRLTNRAQQLATTPARDN